jgi:succinate dehydrogenase / fumarate reductase, membrane anchor subunit
MKYNSTLNAASAAGDTGKARSGLAVWLSVRITGLLLVVLVFAHFAYTHLIHDVADTNAAFVSSRMRSPLFLAWDLSMLGLALFHGVAGNWGIIREYTTKWRSYLRFALVLLASLMLMLGILALI